MVGGVEVVDAEGLLRCVAVIPGNGRGRDISDGGVVGAGGAEAGLISVGAPRVSRQRPG